MAFSIKWKEVLSPGAKQYQFDENALEAIFAAHDADELRGLGCIPARKELINDILKQFTIVMAQRTGIMPPKPEVAFRDNTVVLTPKHAVAAAAIAKKAE